jgi:hypothetical protein
MAGWQQSPFDVGFDCCQMSGARGLADLKCCLLARESVQVWYGPHSDDLALGALLGSHFSGRLNGAAPNLKLSPDDLYTCHVDTVVARPSSLSNVTVFKCCNAKRGFKASSVDRRCSGSNKAAILGPT